MAEEKTNSETGEKEESNDKSSAEKALDKVDEKVEEGKSIDKANKELAAENNIKETPSGDEITKGEKAISAIGYVLYFCILALVLKPKSQFCHFHGMQGLVLTLIFILFSWMRWFGFWGQLIWLLLILVPIIIGIIQAIQGNYWRCPVVNVMSEKLRKWIFEENPDDIKDK